MLIRIYCDGGCSNNQEEKNLGGWGYLLEAVQDGRILKTATGFGSAADTTNNRMEMTALIEALSALNRDGLHIEVYSDSKYVVNCFNEKWYETWQRTNWKKGTVKNIDLWQKLLALVEKHEITFLHVKGHINLEHPSTNVEKHYQAFNKTNDTEVSLEFFQHIVECNNKVDALAQEGIKSIRDAKKK